jgi:transposase
MPPDAPVVRSVKENIQLAETTIVRNRFDIMMLVKKIQSIGDAFFAGTRFITLTSVENLSNKQRERFSDLIDSGVETGKAWAYKEMLRDLWACLDGATAISYFRAWYKRVIHASLVPLKRIAGTIKERLANVVNYCTHGITSAVAKPSKARQWRSRGVSMATDTEKTLRPPSTSTAVGLNSTHNEPG